MMPRGWARNHCKLGGASPRWSSPAPISGKRDGEGKAQDQARYGYGAAKRGHQDDVGDFRSAERISLTKVRWCHPLLASTTRFVVQD